ncbi:hypothetical protein FRB99_005614 [Tulasnella sp. 403]|nr:hypothetical protein FRB99_005614 [Tulasnella sp. 403]
MASSVATLPVADALLRDAYGRKMNATNELYVLPVDTPEHTRLELQHEVFTLQVGLYFRPDVVERILAPRPAGSPPPTVIDIGTGSGIWAIEMAKKFPHVQVVGIDLARPNVSQKVPPNCRFECRDINNGLKNLTEAPFDVVHVRCVSPGIADYRDFLKDEVLAILRPGGVFLSIEGDIQTFNEFKEPIIARNEGEPAQGNVGMTLYHRITELLQEMGDVWTETGKEVQWAALGPWPPELSEKERYIAELMRQNLFNIVRAYLPMRLSAGHDPGEVKKLVEQIDDELSSMRGKTWTRFIGAWGIKKSE